MTLPFAWRRLTACLLAGLLYCLMACSAPAASTTPTLPTQTPTLQLIPYLTPTAIMTATPPTLLQAPQVIVPSPTPLTHTVVKGDTLLGIALQYGIKTDDILAANPGIDPQFLSIDTALIIPLEESGIPQPPTAEPLPLVLEPPVCYQTAAADYWCFVSALNGSPDPVESVSAQIDLLDSQGEVLDSQVAITALNLIQGQARLPLVAFFNGPLPEQVYPTVQLLTAFPGQSLEQRYLGLRLDSNQTELAPDGKSARLRGVLRLPSASQPASQVRALAVAYAADGNVVGVRVWDSPQGLEAGDQVVFDITVYSLGEKIERTELFTEARPKE